MEDPAFAKPHGYWNDFENASRHARELEKELGKFPSKRDMVAAGLSGLAAAIDLHYGGMRAFRRLMGVEQVRKPQNFWKDIGVVVSRLRSLKKMLGFLPSWREM